MRIGELASLCGCPIETIRYYEKIGLLPKPRRTRNGYRDYDDQHRKWLQFILRSRALGFSQEDVRRLTRVARAGKTCGDVHALLAAHLEQVHDKLTELRRMERALTRLKAKCERDTLAACPVIDELMR